MKIYKVKFEGQWCAFDKMSSVLEEVQSFLENMEDDDNIELSVEEMSEEDWKNMPEFAGW